MALSRQTMQNLDGTGVEYVEKGFYVVHETKKNGKIDVIMLASGTELSLTIEAAIDLEQEGVKVRVVSTVCWELFESQSDSYKEVILPVDIKTKVSVEAGSSFGW